MRRGEHKLTIDQLQKYDMVVQSLIEMGVDVVYPVELPAQSSLNLDGKNSFEPVVCRYLYIRCVNGIAD